MKKFIYKIIIILLIMFVIVGGLNYLYINTEYYNGLNDMGKFDCVPDGVEYANFGNSHSYYGFEWEYLETCEGFDFSLPSQTLEYDAAIFEEYKTHFAENSTIFVEISHRSLYEKGEPVDDIRFNRYYRILNRRNSNPNWTLGGAIRYGFLPLLGDRDGLMYIFNDKEILENIHGEVLEESKAKTSARGRAEKFIRAIGEQELGEQYLALCGMLEKADERNIRVVLITAPTTGYFSEVFSRDFYEKFYNDIDMILEKYDNVQYVDFTNDPEFTYNLEYFFDEDHLNIAGSKAFMKRIENILQKNGK